MSDIIIKDNESIDSALRRFNKKVQQDRILAEIRRKEYYEKPFMKRKKKAATKKRKSLKTTLRAMI